MLPIKPRPATVEELCRCAASISHCSGFACSQQPSSLTIDWETLVAIDWVSAAAYDVRDCLNAALQFAHHAQVGWGTAVVALVIRGTQHQPGHLGTHWSPAGLQGAHQRICGVCASYKQGQVQSSTQNRR